ncbi:hypothetical protein GCM10023200_36720 [Actinomycetospora chlora]|uniref:DUF7455 domain-containing protein n=1 Tax=Actinomycetospora chlora TaxID=663608 RepID=A0ABP9BLY4_9PSEU
MTSPITAPLTTPQRCDRCVARAAFVAHVPGGGELLFCGHHHRRHREGLLASGALVWPLPVDVAVDTRDDAA